MPIEAIIYFIVVSLSLTMIVRAGAAATQRPSFVKAFFVAISLVTISRLLGLDDDYGRYIKIMQQGPEHFVSYWQREFIFWLPFHWVHEIANNVYITLFVFDIVLLFVLTIFLYKTKADKAHIFLAILLLSFPFFLCFQNIYRQGFAMAFLIAAYVIRDESKLKSDILFLVAVFSHNYIAIFYPILLCRGFYFLNPDYSLKLGLLSMLVMILMLIGMRYGDSGLLRGGKETGLDLSIAYIALFILLAIYFKFFSDNYNKILISSPSTIFAVMMLVSFYIAGIESSIIERLGMTFLVITIIDIIDQPIKSNILKAELFYALLLVCVSVPVFLFPSARAMLNTI